MAADKSEEEANAAEGAEGVDLPKKKISGKKLAIIAVAALLLLGGGGGAAFFLLGSKDEAAHGEADPHGEKKDGEHGAEGEEANAAPVYLQMPNINVNLISTTRNPAYAKVVINLLLAKEEDKTGVTANMPRIIDSFQGYLRELTAAEIQGAAGLLRLREELTVRANAAVAPAVIKDVLFQEIMVQAK